MNTILVPVNILGATSLALDVGWLARRLDAHLEVLHVALDPRDSVALLGEGMTGTMAEAGTARSIAVNLFLANEECQAYLDRLPADMGI